MYWWDERSNRLERASLDGNSRELFSLVPSTIVGLAVDKEFVYLAEKRYTYYLTFTITDIY